MDIVDIPHRSSSDEGSEGNNNDSDLGEHVFKERWVETKVFVERTGMGS